MSFEMNMNLKLSLKLNRFIAVAFIACSGWADLSYADDCQIITTLGDGKGSFCCKVGNGGTIRRPCVLPEATSSCAFQEIPGRTWPGQIFHCDVRQSPALE